MLSAGGTDKLESLIHRVRDTDLWIEAHMENDLLRPDPALAPVHIRRSPIELTYYMARIHSLLLWVLAALAVIAIILIIK